MAKKYVWICRMTAAYLDPNDIFSDTDDIKHISKIRYSPLSNERLNATSGGHGTCDIGGL